MVLLSLFSMPVHLHATVLLLPLASKLPDDPRIMQDLAVVAPCIESFLNPSPGQPKPLLVTGQCYMLPCDVHLLAVLLHCLLLSYDVPCLPCCLCLLVSYPSLSRFTAMHLLAGDAYCHAMPLS
jgi:hypothetical protein